MKDMPCIRRKNCKIPELYSCQRQEIKRCCSGDVALFEQRTSKEKFLPSRLSDERARITIVVILLIITALIQCSEERWIRDVHALAVFDNGFTFCNKSGNSK